ncbi:hypothetical protein [Oleomonas cavernae]
MSAAKAKAAFVWEDPFLLEEQLSEDERLVRDSVRAYAQDKLLPASSRPSRKSASIARS